MDDGIIERSTSEDVRSSLAAMKRAALRARQLGKTAGTGIVVQRNGRMVQAPPEEIDPQGAEQLAEPAATVASR